MAPKKLLEMKTINSRMKNVLNIINSQLDIMEGGWNN